MAHELLDLARTLIAWGNDGVERAADDAIALLARGPEEWDAWLESEPKARNCQTFFALLDRSDECLDHDPTLAAAIDAFITRHLDDVPVPPELDAIHLRLRGAAVQQCADFFRHGGQLAEAVAAFQQVIDYYEDDPTAVLERACARRGYAFALHQEGHSGEALRILREDLPVFRSAHDIGGELRSRFCEGLILEAINPHEGISAFADALHLAQLLGDRRTIARVLLHLGHVVPDLRDANTYLRQALPVLSAEGLRNDVALVRWGVARLHARQGHIDEAVSGFVDVMEEMDAAGCGTDAGRCGLDALNVLLLAERYDYVAETAIELFHYFHTRGLLPEATQALGIVREVERNKGATETQWTG
jgi:tetratricopeptide (TPR) repeat protein